MDAVKYLRGNGLEDKEVRGSDGAMATIDLSHYMCHGKKKFHVGKAFLAVAKDASAYLRLVTPEAAGAEYHLTFDVSAGSTAYISMYEGTVYGVSQVETATAAGNVSAGGNASVVVTAAGMTGTPKTIAVAVATSDTPALWAAKVRAALAADVAVAAMFNVAGATDKIILTRKIYAANDATLNVALATGTATGITTAATSANTTAGVADAPGTGVTPVCKNRITTLGTTAVTAFHTPTPSVLGTVLRDGGVFEGGTGQGAVGNAHSERDEWVFGAGADILIAVQNKDASAAKNINITAEWYEV